MPGLLNGRGGGGGGSGGTSGGSGANPATEQSILGGGRAMDFSPGRVVLILGYIQRSNAASITGRIPGVRRTDGAFNTGAVVGVRNTEGVIGGAGGTSYEAFMTTQQIADSDVAAYMLSEQQPGATANALYFQAGLLIVDVVRG